MLRICFRMLSGIVKLLSFLAAVVVLAVFAVAFLRMDSTEPRTLLTPQEMSAQFETTNLLVDTPGCYTREQLNNVLDQIAALGPVAWRDIGVECIDFQKGEPVDAVARSGDYVLIQGPSFLTNKMWWIPRGAVDPSAMRATPLAP